MSDVYIADTTRTVRRSLFQRLKQAGMTQHQLTRTVASATRAVVDHANVADLATIAAAIGPLRTALATAAPGDPALATFNGVLTRVGTPVRGLVEPIP